jgi:ADP-heptose:LPS heptosyltransferase
MAAPENILLIRLKSIGDVVFTLPAVHVIRCNFPDAKLHFLVSKEHAPLLRGFSEIDSVIPLDRATSRSGNLPAVCAAIFQLLRRLRQPRFSHSIDFQGYGETAFLSWWSGAPERWGNVYQSLRGWAYTHGVRSGNAIHPAEQNLFLLQQCGIDIGRIRNEYVLPGDALEIARQFFATNHLDTARPTLFVQPFTSASHKNWPLENYLKLAQHWNARGAQIIFGGGPADHAALEPARAASFTVSAGVPLLVSAGLMKLSTLVVGGDTGLLHLTVAMGRRVVMLMRSNHKGNVRGQTFPFQHPDWAVMAAASQPIASVEISTVIDATTHAMDRWQNGSAESFCVP